MNWAHDVRGGGWLETLLADLRSAARSLRRSPAFTIPTLLILVFGVGSTTLLFTALSAAAYNQLPVPRAHELVRVYAGRSVAYPSYVTLAGQAPEAVRLAAFGQRPLSARLRGRPAERVIGEVVTRNYFDVLQVTPTAGRIWDAHEQPSGGAPVVVSLRLARRLNLTASDMGAGIWINGDPGTVVAILPATFAGSNPGFQADLWVPLDAVGAFRVRLDDRRDRWLSMIGRRDPGVPPSQLEERLAVRPAAGESDRVIVERAKGLAVSPDSSSPFLVSILAVWTLIAIVLLVSCASVAGFLVARSVSARTEIALRLALGASRARLAQQMLCETVLLSLLAGAISLALAFVVGPSIGSLLPEEYGLPLLDTRLTPLAAFFTFITSCLSGLLFGVLPARQLWDADLDRVLRGIGGATPRRTRLSNVLVVVQVAGAVLLLVTAGSIVWSVLSAAHAATETTRRLLIVPLPLLENGYTESRAMTFAESAREHLLALPGIRSAALAQFGMYSGSSNLRRVEIPGRSPIEVESNQVGAGYFSTMHVGVVAGREFLPPDNRLERPPVIINVALARRLGERPSDAVGMDLRFGDAAGARIVGVVEDVENVQPGEGGRPFVYEALTDHSHVALHIEADAGNSAVPMIRAAVTKLDVDLPLRRIATVEDQMDLALAPRRRAAAAAGGLGSTSLFLAAVGVYGILAFWVATRTRELGIRIALGATPVQVVALVLRQALPVTGTGVAVGLVTAIASVRLLESRIGSGVQGLPVISTLTALLVCACVGVACWRPARRSLSAEPLRALKVE